MNFTFNLGELLGVVGLVVTAIGIARAQAATAARLGAQLEALKEATGHALTDIKAEHIRSAADQGTRLGSLRDDVGTLMDFKARTEGAADKERDLSGVVRNQR